jgi:hypothetical protein
MLAINNNEKQNDYIEIYFPIVNDYWLISL